jgi:hypothetical protein
MKQPDKTFWNRGELIMKKNIVIAFFLLLIMTLSACNYDFKGVYKENVRWRSQDDLLEFEIQGPYNEKEGYGKIKINDEIINVYVHLDIEFGGWLNIMDFNDFNHTIIEFDIETINGTVLNLITYSNNSGDLIYDDLQLTINRTDISEEDLDAKKYLFANFVNEEYGLNINGGYLTAFSRNGEMNYDNRDLDIRIDYLNDNKFEIYDNNDNALLFSGQYTSTKKYIELILDSNDFYPSSLSSIILEIVQPDL